MRKIAVYAIAVSILFLGGCTSQVQQKEQSALSAAKSVEEKVFVRISPEDFAQKSASGEYTVIDVRTPQEYAQARITDNALNIDINGDDFARRMVALPKDKKYLVYCRSGNRSAKAVAFMKKHGFNHVEELIGGINAWQAAGYAVTSDN